jgi:uncharacterized membrane protein (UPF0127 family)
MREKLLREYVRRIINEQHTTQDILVGQASCSVEIANTDRARARGMMGRRDILDGTGMLFIYPQSMYLSFWMKNTPSPLSIAFIDEVGKIIEISDLQPFSERSVKSSRPCRAALEVPQGWFSKNRVVPGDFIS